MTKKRIRQMNAALLRRLSLRPAAEYLAAEQGLMTLPGPFFGPGQERHLRLAFANAEAERLAELPARLAGLG